MEAAFATAQTVFRGKLLRTHPAVSFGFDGKVKLNRRCFYGPTKLDHGESGRLFQSFAVVLFASYVLYPCFT